MQSLFVCIILYLFKTHVGGTCINGNSNVDCTSIQFITYTYYA